MRSYASVPWSALYKTLNTRTFDSRGFPWTPGAASLGAGQARARVFPVWHRVPDTQRPEIGVLVHHVPVLERPPFRLLLCQQVTPVRRRGTGRRPAGDAAAQWDRLSVGRGSRRESALHHLSEPRGQPSPSIAE